MHGLIMLPKNKTGFVLITPLLGSFFLLISISLSAYFISENNAQIDIARAGDSNFLSFVASAVQADAFNVYMQNYLQQIIDNYMQQNIPLAQYIPKSVEQAMEHDLTATYTELYQNAFGVDCIVSGAMYSHVMVVFNGQYGINILGTDKLFTPDYKTAIWPYPSRYRLICTTDEPPMMAKVIFETRWYYFDATAICEAYPNACSL